ncbi:MAG: rRNA maturation RNase YbeY [Burkholderiaceae bacterium]|nr:rRNA maturation RNase YbeY [Burkholderiaceae bacterium]MDH3459624.1 rRNA maturation RNase YbeY [Burkholderiaceae bacterium]
MRPSLSLSLQFADSAHRAQLPRHKVARWVRAAIEAPARITVRVVGRQEAQALNRDFRGKDYATNVLTFSYEQSPLVWADLVLCSPVVAQEARDAAKSLQAHYAHLIVHGTLHAQGYDHHAKNQARVMEAREAAVLAALGFCLPHAANPGASEW